MFVLMDIEWIESRFNNISPTQIAAIRVDGQYNCSERFYSRIRPRDKSFHTWSHIAYAGGAPSDFLCAHDIPQVLTQLQDLLCEDDVLCFWHSDSVSVFSSIYRSVFDAELPQRVVVLRDYLFPFLAERKMRTGSPYSLCSEYGLQFTVPQHHSGNDVAVILKALEYLRYPMQLLYAAPPCETTPDSSAPGCSAAHFDPHDTRPYRLETETGIFHKAGCSAIPENALLTAHPDLKYYFRKKLKACRFCMKETAREGARLRNRDIISRAHYQFVYTESSEVFHRRGCSAILSTTGTILGSSYYHTCAATGRRPCKLCKPTVGTWLSVAAPGSKPNRSARQVPASCTTTAVPGRQMNAKEQRAYARYAEARAERLAAANNTFASEAERADFYTLTQSGFVFFCGAGYQSFHRRSCRKLQGLSNITGFARYKDAIRAGHTPCKLCKPSAKLDIEYSIPITNEYRRGESISELEALCIGQGYTYEIFDKYFIFSTALGKWKIDFSSSPYVVYHINRIRTPNNEHSYHRQPRLFLSLPDVFDYIRRHDRPPRKQALGTSEYASAV